jgi:hypothetical protein
MYNHPYENLFRPDRNNDSQWIRSHFGAVYSAEPNPLDRYLVSHFPDRKTRTQTRAEIVEAAFEAMKVDCLGELLLEKLAPSDFRRLARMAMRPIREVNGLYVQQVLPQCAEANIKLYEPLLY